MENVLLPLPSLQGRKSHASSGYSCTDAVIRIMSSSGRPLSSIVFPPLSVTNTGKHQGQNVASYAPEDIHTIGFTTRWILLVIMRDGFCFSYDLR